MQKTSLHLFVFLGIVLLAYSCKRKECIDCEEVGQNRFFTFCDPPEPPEGVFDSLSCGNIYKN